jgi:TolB-like protein/predicted Zn-dependent protease
MFWLKRIIREIHQRSLWQALAVYLGASYAVLEAAAYFRDEFGLPAWLPSVALILLLIGLPIVIVTSLARPEVYGDEVQPADARAAAEEDRQLQLFTWRTAGLSFLGAMALWGVIAAGLVLTGTYERVAEDERRAIAVLPFDNISPDPGDAYFAAGMHDEIIAQLGMIQSLAVISRNSVMKYRPGMFPMRQIAAELGVDFVLEGSARKDTARTRITLQLIDANTDQHLWVQEYDRELSSASLLDIQDDIARRVVGALRARISSIERGRISGGSTESRVAYELYLRSNQLDYNWDRAANTAAAELLTQALALDPGFAKARATLAYAYVAKALFLGYPRREWADSGIALARRAIDDDPSLPLGHYALAAGHDTLGQLTDAVEGFKKVLELQPSNGTALAWVSWIQYQRGQLDEAVDLVRRAFRVDPRGWNLPFNMVEYETTLGNYRNAERWLQVAEARTPNHPFLSTHRVLILLAEEKTSEAVEEAERNLSEDPQDLVEALTMAAEALLRAGNFEQALQYLEEVYRISPEGWDVVGRSRRTPHGWALLKLGDTERGLALLEEVVQEAHRLVDQGNEEPVLRRELAAVYAASGDRQRAYEWLERAIDSGWRLERTYPSPLFESLHGEERFQQLMDRIDVDIERMKIRVEREGLTPPFPSDD